MKIRRNCPNTMRTSDDTTALNYLVLIGQIELLSALYQRVLIPQEVHRELQQSRTPPPVSHWAASLPAWCEVRASSSTRDPALSELFSP